jgi:hypothetical protein
VRVTWSNEPDGSRFVQRIVVPGQPGADSALTGVVTAVNAGSRTIAVRPSAKQGAAPVTAKVAAGATVEVLGQPATLAGVKVGDRVALSGSVVNSTLTAVHVDSFGLPPVTSTISGSAVSASPVNSTLTFTPSATGAKPATLKVSPNTTVTRLGKKVALSAILSGDQLQVTTSTTADKTVTVVSVADTGPAPVVRAAAGLVKAVNAKAGTLSYAPSTGPVVTVKLAAGTVVNRLGKKSSLSAVKVWDRVTVTTSTTWDKKVTVVKVDDAGPPAPTVARVAGVVKSVNAKAGTITYLPSTKGAKAVTVKISTKLPLVHKGKKAAVKSVKAKQRVVVTTSTTVDKKVTIVKIEF